MSYNNLDDVLSKLDDVENKIDTLIELEAKRLQTLPTYVYYHTFEGGKTKNGDSKMAQVGKRNDGVWCVEKFINNRLIERLPLEGKSETYAENCAENFVLLD